MADQKRSDDLPTVIVKLPFNDVDSEVDSSQSESHVVDIFETNGNDAFNVEGTNRHGNAFIVEETNRPVCLDITPADDKSSEDIAKPRAKLDHGQMVSNETGFGVVRLRKTEKAIISFFVSMLEKKPHLFRKALEKIMNRRIPKQTTRPEQPSLWTRLIKNVKSTFGFPDKESHLKMV